MQIEFLGAARTVTGSMHLVSTKHARILLDCGLFQGRRRESFERNQHLPFDPKSLDAIVLSHAHIDHSGALPLASKHGFSGAIYATPATRDLCAVMLADAAMIQAADARYVNKVIERDGVEMDPVEPLYDQDDVTNVLGSMISVPYRLTHTIAPGVKLTFLDAGHVLGSAVVVLDCDDDGTPTRLVFTGDLGRNNMPILKDPEVPEHADVLLSESTYGDRNHPPIEEMDDQLAEILRKTHARGGKVIIPSFALERAQELLYAISRLRKSGKMPPMRVFVDSPLTVKITDIFRMHPECYDDETRERLRSQDSPFEFEGLTYTNSPEGSKAIDAGDAPSLIISASGMCEAGRILHHLKANVEDERNSIVIVGFQAQHTLGRRLVERRPRVKIFGVERDLRAEVHVLNGFSAHADQNDLLRYAKKVNNGGRLKKVILVHGEPRAQDVLVSKLRAQGNHDISCPEQGDVISF